MSNFAYTMVIDQTFFWLVAGISFLCFVGVGIKLTPLYGRLVAIVPILVVVAIILYGCYTMPKYMRNSLEVNKYSITDIMYDGTSYKGYFITDNNQIQEFAFEGWEKNPATKASFAGIQSIRGLFGKKFFDETATQVFLNEEDSEKAETLFEDYWGTRKAT